MCREIHQPYKSHGIVRTLADNPSEGNALPFEGIYVNYKRSGLAASSFQQIEAGQTVTASVNAAKSYKLEGISQAKVTAIQGFRYAVGTDAPSSVQELALCEDVTSGEVEVTPDQATVAEYVVYTTGHFATSVLTSMCPGSTSRTSVRCPCRLVSKGAPSRTRRAPPRKLAP